MEKLNNIVVQLSSHGKLVAERSAILRKKKPTMTKYRKII